MLQLAASRNGLGSTTKQRRNHQRKHLLHQIRRGDRRDLCEMAKPSSVPACDVGKPNRLTGVVVSRGDLDDVRADDVDPGQGPDDTPNFACRPAAGLGGASWGENGRSAGQIDRLSFRLSLRFARPSGCSLRPLPVPSILYPTSLSTHTNEEDTHFPGPCSDRWYRCRNSSTRACPRPSS